MDTAAILARNPELCAVDEFPHTNVPGSERTKRWEDVMVLLEAGIGVLTTMNIQHLESLNDQVREIANVQVRETIPDWVVKQADEVVLVDVPPQALLNRLQRGVIYGTAKPQQALNNFFKESTLGALREMALRQTAHEVDVRQVELTSEPKLPSRAHPDSHHGIAGHRRADPPRPARGGLSEGGLLRGMRAAAGGDGESVQSRRARRSSGIWNSRGACISRRAFSKGRTPRKRWWISRAAMG